MRFWCSVSDRCSGKIGKGGRLRQAAAAVFTLFVWYKGHCHILHDWCGCRRIVRAYLHDSLVREADTSRASACRALFVLHTLRKKSCQAGVQESSSSSSAVPLWWNQFTFPTMIHYVAKAARHCCYHILIYSHLIYCPLYLNCTIVCSMSLTVKIHFWAV